MLCKITLTGDQRSQEVQILKAIRAVATAAAGSTPSAICSTVHNDASSSPYEIITVLDNTTAGGWTVHADGTNLDTDVEAGSGYQKFIQLYSTTTKSALPYAWIKFITSTATATAQAPFGCMTFWGFSASTSNLTADGNDINSHVGILDTYNSGAVPAWSATNGKQDYYMPLNFSNTIARTYYIACNSEYIHVQQGCDATDGNSPNGAFLHFGTRTYSTWEDNFTDNPYWVGLYGTQGLGNVSNSVQGYFTRMRLFQVNSGATTATTSIIKRSNSSSTNTAGPIYFNHSSTYYSMSQRSGNYTNDAHTMYYPSQLLNMNSTYASSSTNGTNTMQQSSFNLKGPIIYPSAPSGSTLNMTRLESDPVSGAMIPSAEPLMILPTAPYAGGGYMKHLFQSPPFQSTTYLNLYHILDTPVNINGETFVGLRHGNYTNASDIARQLLYVKTS